MGLRINTSGWRGNQDDADEFIAITREILGRSIEAREIGEVYLIDTLGRYTEPQRGDNYFGIYFHARADRNAGIQKLPNKLYGFSTRGDDDGETYPVFEPSGDGMVIVEPQSGCALAELIGNSLYLLFPARSAYTTRRDAKLEVYREILKETRSLIGEGLPTLEEIMTGNFVCPNKAGLQRLKRELPKYRKDVTQLVSHGSALDEQLLRMGANNNGADQIIDRLASIPEVKRLSMDGSHMVVDTHTMYGTHPRRGSIHEYGEFKIDLTFGGGGTASFRNVTRRPGGYGHPHVDRGDNYWCMGEGQGILRLLQDFEVEAAVLFAIKAIDSVNDSTDGNYLTILSSFPRVDKRVPYPKKKAQLDDEMCRKFVRVFGGTLDDSRIQLEQSISKTRERVAAGQAKILEGKLAETLETLALNARTNLAQKARALMGDQIGRIRELEPIRRVSVKGNVLQVETNKLKTTDIASRSQYQIGPFTLTYDFSSGSITFESASPIRSRGGKNFQAPQLPGNGELPLGQLSSTLPELLGSLELETAVSVSLDFLTSFNKKDVDPSVLDRIRQAA